MCFGFNVLNKNKLGPDNDKDQLPPLFKRLDRISHQKDSQLEHTKSWVNQSRQHFREELDCSLCSDLRPTNDQNNKTLVGPQMAWTDNHRDVVDQSLVDQRWRGRQANRNAEESAKIDGIGHRIDGQSNNAQNQRLTPSESHAINQGIDSNLLFERSPNDCPNKSFLLRNRSIASFDKHLSSSLESICGSNDETNAENADNNTSFESCNQFSIETEIHYSVSNDCNETANYVKNFSANLMLNSHQMSSMTTALGQRCGECSFCEFVANGGHQRWNELDTDVIKLMETVDKLSALLAQKEISLNKECKDVVQFKERNDKKLKEKIIELRNKKRIGMSLHKIGAGKRLMVFKDGHNTYQIESKSSFAPQFNLAQYHTTAGIALLLHWYRTSHSTCSHCSTR